MNHELYRANGNERYEHVLLIMIVPCKKKNCCLLFLYLNHIFTGDTDGHVSLCQVTYVLCCFEATKKSRDKTVFVCTGLEVGRESNQWGRGGAGGGTKGCNVILK